MLFPWILHYIASSPKEDTPPSISLIFYYRLQRFADFREDMSVVSLISTALLSKDFFWIPSLFPSSVHVIWDGASLLSLYESAPHTMLATATGSGSK